MILLSRQQSQRNQQVCKRILLQGKELRIRLEIHKTLPAASAICAEAPESGCQNVMQNLARQNWYLKKEG